jgi:hypothetical protein
VHDVFAKINKYCQPHVGSALQSAGMKNIAKGNNKKKYVNRRGKEMEELGKNLNSQEFQVI